MSESGDGAESISVTENQEQLQELLRDLFQFDAEDLDFGIYRILNQRRDIIEEFIEQDLIDTVHDALGEIIEQEREELEQDLSEAREEVEAALGEGAFDGNDISEQYQGAPVTDDYIDVKEQLEQLEVAEQTEARIFNDLYRFFSRFYDRGDFHVKRRFSSQDSKYMVPYNGEEVFFHWANRNQYYVKTSEHFTAYRFDTDNLSVEFTLEKANVPQDNVKGDERYFVLGRNPVSWDDTERELTINFQYRLITEEEANEFVETYNEVTGNDRSSFNRKTNTILCTALQQGILNHIDNGELQRELQSEGDGETVLMQHLTRYTSENTMDYFIHKDLGGYLRDELDYYLQNEILETDELVSTNADREPTSIRRARVVRQIGERVIEFLDQIESFQQRLFEKRKFVSQTDYMVTLDKVPETLYEKILDNEEQLEQWREVYNIDEWDNSLTWLGEFSEEFIPNNKYLMVDTKLFDDDFKHQLLASFEDIEDETDGTLIQGDNFQALNLLLEKYRSNIHTIYIDPPYNTGNEFIYKDNFQHSSWLSMMNSRLAKSRQLLSDNGLFFSSIDDNELNNLAHLLDNTFSERVNLVAVRNNPKGRGLDKYMSKSHEYLFSYAQKPTELSGIPKSEEKIAEQYNQKDENGRYRLQPLRNTHREYNRQTRENLWYPLYVDTRSREVYLENAQNRVEVYPIWDDGMEGCWTWDSDKAQEDRELLVGKKSGGRWKIYRKDYAKDGDSVVTYTPKTIWDDNEMRTDYAQQLLDDIMGDQVFRSPKPPALIKRAIQISDGKGDTVLDFFAGSGTTAQSVMELNHEREEDMGYILVDIGEHLENVAKRRVQKLAFSLNWDDGIPEKNLGQSHMVRYHQIESYEDALNNVVLEEPTDEEQQTFTQDQREEYVSGYMLDFESEGASLMEPTSFEQPFDHELDIERNGVGRESVAVDLVETFHYLLGADVHRFETYEHQDRKYVVTECSVERENSVDSVLTVWRNARDLDIEEEREWVADELEREQFDQMYINSESAVPGAEPVEVTFKTRMEAASDGAE